MDLAADKELPDDIVLILKEARSRGVRLWAENGELRYRGPRGAFSREDLDRLSAFKGRILRVLDVERRVASVDGASTCTCAPLTFAQLTHLNTYKLYEKPAIRQIAAALRFCDELHVEALVSSLRQLVWRHHALRTNVVMRDGVWIQEVHDCADIEVEIEDLSGISGSNQDAAVQSRIDDLIMQPIDIRRDPLFGAKLLRLRDGTHVLIVAMEHIISDGFSLSILIRDLVTAYAQKIRGGEIALPAIPVQFAEYAKVQRADFDAWRAAHSPHWSARLRYPRLRFPSDRAANSRRKGWGAINVRVPLQLRVALEARCRAWQTTLALGVFSAYVALVMNWCQTREAIFLYQSDGRREQNLENTIGLFAGALFIPIEISLVDSFADLVRNVTKEYCASYEHADLSFLAAQPVQPEFVHNTTFNWLPGKALGAGCPPMGRSDAAIKVTPVHFSHPMAQNLELDAEPSILLVDSEQGVAGEFWYPKSRFVDESMHTFVQNFIYLLSVLVDDPRTRVTSVKLT